MNENRYIDMDNKVSVRKTRCTIDGKFGWYDRIIIMTNTGSKVFYRPTEEPKQNDNSHFKN